MSLEHKEEQATWYEIWRDRSLRDPALLSLGIVYFRQMTGINCILFFSKSIFMEAGLHSQDQLTMALLAVASTEVFFTAITCLINDMTGRKVLLVIGTVLMTTSLVAFGAYIDLGSSANETNQSFNQSKEHSSMDGIIKTAPEPTKRSPPAFLAPLCLVVFIASYAIGPGPISWLLVGEIIPARAKKRAVGLPFAFNYILSFTLTFCFSKMENVLTPQGTFWFFAGNCALSIFFIVFLIPETKGKTLEEIEAYFRKRTETAVIK